MTLSLTHNCALLSTVLTPLLVTQLCLHCLCVEITAYYPNTFKLTERMKHYVQYKRHLYTINQCLYT